MNSVVSPEILGYMEHSSWIRRMFEAGIELKKKYGDDQVYDFSLGNPDMPPPPEVKSALLDFAQTADQPYSIGYMPNAGFPDTRAALARKVSQEQSAGIDASHVVVTCGAAGGLNAVFRATLEPGCEVLCPAPYFVEYGFYVSNFGGKLRPVPSHPEDFSLDIEGFRTALSDKTRAVIINSPNNPTGRIYNRKELAALADLLREQSEKNGRPILLISDEPYRFLNFEHTEIPSLFSLYDDSVVIGSFSKNLSLAGERVGYVAAAPNFHGVKEFIAAVTMTNRILGFVNAPAIGQRVLNRCIDCEVDPVLYGRRRDMMADVLREAGFEFYLPPGAFYFFPKAPIEDDVEFVRILQGERVLAVPGVGFGMAGFIRLAFCVPERTITESLPSFKRAMAAARR